MPEQDSELPQEQTARIDINGDEVTAEILKKNLENLINDYGRQLTELREKGTVLGDIRPVVHEMGTLKPAAGESPEEFLAGVRGMFISVIDDKEFQGRTGLTPEPLSGQFGSAGMLRTITRFGEVATLVENVYLDSEGKPTEYRPQLWVPSYPANLLIKSELSKPV